MEELKLTIEMLNGLGENTMDAFIAWVAAEYIVRPLFGVIMLSLPMLVIYKILAPFLERISFVEQIKAAAKISGELNQHEKISIIGCIRNNYRR